MATREKSANGHLVGDQANWHNVYELLREAQYKLVAELLYKVQAENEQAGNVLLAEILAVIGQICLACNQYQVGAEWHRQASEEANGREHELRDHLYAILELIAESGVLGLTTQPARAGPDKFKSSTSNLSPLITLHHLWQRIQSTLGWSLPLPGSQPPSEGRPEVLPPPAVESIDPPAAPTPELKIEPESGNADPPYLVIHCLGSFRVYHDQTFITNWSGGKGKAIFKYLVTNRNRPIHKDVLMDLFWANANPEAARNNLNVAIHNLRQTFKALQPRFSCILFQDDHYLLNPAMTIWVDFENFIQTYQMGQTLEKQGKLVRAIQEYELAEGLYQGDFLEEDPYEDWPIIQRESLKDSYLIILERLSRYYFEEKKYATCIHLCQKILAKDDCREDAHRRLMQCYSHQGQIRLALRQYHLCVESLLKVLDVAPAQETVDLYHQIRTREKG